MGPEPESSGKRAIKCAIITKYRSFNGAGAGKLRKTKIIVNDAYRHEGLQWGRSRKAPENLEGGEELRAFEKLQWGRSRKAPENFKSN